MSKPKSCIFLFLLCILLSQTLLAQQYPGDANSDGTINISDIVWLINYLCNDGSPPDPLANGDANGDCIIDINDVRLIVYYYFGPAYYCVEIVDSTCENPTTGFCEDSDLNLTDNSFSDPVLVTCPMADMPFRVYLRDQDDNAVAGLYPVWLELHNVSDMQRCDGSDMPEILCPVGPADSLGRLTFLTNGSYCPADGYAVIYAMGVSGLPPTPTAGIIETVPIKALDTDGDLAVSYLGDYTGDLCNDYNGDGIVNIADANIFTRHIGHNCGYDPCRLFYTDFELIPESNLEPGDQIQLRLTIENNSPDTCYVGLIDIFESTFASGTTYDLFTTVPYNQAMYPGRNDTIDIDYTVPDNGQGCLKAVLETDCCADPVETLPQCFQSIQHCLIDSNVCYDFIIPLTDNFPIEYIILNLDSLGPGWTYVENHLPSQFPITAPDNISYSICTPNLSDLGDSAKMLFYVCHDAACTDIDVFETNVVITSRTGDTNGDCSVNISDAVYIINYIFVNGPEPLPHEAGNVNCVGDVDVSDAVWLINFIFIPGSPPPCLPE